ncbi:MAG: serine/threonine protein kinase [Desulfitobacteriaceae bacterium]|nr:serine/threonine protein kinase [Desulfitobacteriaceae bacterium]MDD4753470.1 serine/threonine protein kinase [Desulfitobacteriaceae bacterium]
MRETDLKKYSVIGEGRHGVVYLLDEKRCAKKYWKKKYGKMEFQVLDHSRHYIHFPRVYDFNGRIMVREYCNGLNAKEYIRKHGLTRALAYKLVEIISIFEELGFSRLDCRLAHLIVTTNLNLKVIDPTRNMTKRVDYPRQMLRELEHMGCKERFLKFASEVRPDYYLKWVQKTISL